MAVDVVNGLKFVAYRYVPCYLMIATGFPHIIIRRGRTKSIILVSLFPLRHHLSKVCRRKPILVWNAMGAVYAWLHRRLRSIHPLQLLTQFIYFELQLFRQNGIWI